MVQIPWPDLPISLVGALIGGILTLLGGAFFNWNKRRIERNQLRRVLSMEMEEITEACRLYAESDQNSILSEGEEAPEDWPDDIDWENKEGWTGFIPPENLSHPQYTANQANIRILSKHEIKHVSEYYRYVEKLHSHMENGGTRRDNARTLAVTIVMCHSYVSDYLTRTVFYRWRQRQLRRWQRLTGGSTDEPVTGRFPFEE